MSSTFTTMVSTLKADPELNARVLAANSPAERVEILQAAGIEVPTKDELDATQALLGDVAGAGSSATSAALNVCWVGVVPNPTGLPT